MENQRVRLSKKMLKDSFIRLLNIKNIHKITVSEICADAKINRTTFYKHYGSQYDLLHDMEEDILVQINHYLSVHNDSPDDSFARLVQLVSFIHDNRDLCKILLDNNVDPDFPEKLIHLPQIKQAVRQFIARNDETEPSYIYHFIVNGGVSVIKCWIGKDPRESPEAIADVLYNIIYKQLRL